MNKSTLLQGVLLSAISFTAFSGCTAKGPQFKKFDTPKEGKSLVYVYRENSFFGAALAPDIHKTNLKTTNDQVIGNVKPAGYIKTEIDAGKKYQIWARTEAKNEVDIDAKNY